MKYVFFTNTPAHVHLYRHAVERLEERGHDVSVLARDDGCTEALLSYFDLPYEIYGGRGDSKYSLAWELPTHAASIVRRVRRIDPDVIFGIGPYAGLASAATGAPAVAVLDSEPSLDHVVARPFVDLILTPDAFRKDLGGKHVRFRGVTETAYLHPDVFEPDPSVREELGVGPDEPYVVVRFNVLNGHHDVGKKGFSSEQLRRLVAELSDHATVFVSDESGRLDFDTLEARPYDLHPARIHDALSHAELLVADTQTMSTEAALLGTPTVRSNSFVGDDDMGNFLELEEYGLMENVADFETVLERSRALLERDDTTETWERRRREYLEKTDDLTALLCEIADAGTKPDAAVAHATRAEVTR